ncbi:MAG: DUF418 domain-containing protein, partial [Pyrinomonadaceae bacterium]
MERLEIPRETTLRPVQPGERIEALDILRGFALFGILLVQITHVLDPFPSQAPADQAVSWFLHLFAESKFYPFFSLLFGVGFAIQLERAERRGGRFLIIYLRRLAVLLLIGFAFYFLVQRYDILISYALLGAPLLLFRKCSGRVLLVSAVICLALAPTVWQIQGAVRSAAAPAPAPGQAAVEGLAGRWAANETRLEEAGIQGDYTELVAGRARRIYLSPLTLLTSLGSWPTIFAMFLLGLYAHLRGVFANTPSNQVFLRRTLIAALGLWAAITFLVQPVIGPPVHV